MYIDSRQLQKHNAFVAGGEELFVVKFHEIKAYS